MNRGVPKKRKSWLPPPTSNQITGLDPTQEELALQNLESGTQDAVTLVNQPMRCLLYKQGEGLVTIHTVKYSIYNEDDIDICSNFLTGECFQGLLCPKHHTAWPYVWQIRYKATGFWFSIDEGAQLILERLYSDPANVNVTGYHFGSTITINLSTMMVGDSLTYDRVRRLSTSVCPSIKFHTVYKYYYEEKDNVWKEYSPDFVKCIEDGLREHQEEVFCSNFAHKYSLHLVNMVQTNLETNTKRRMRKRSVFRSPVAMTQKLRDCNASPCPNTSPETSGSQPDNNSDYPKTWIITDPGLTYEKTHVTLDDTEYTYVYTYFHKTMDESKYVILEVFRIQNYYQWERYSRKKAFLQRKLKETQNGCLERYLFHGTNADRLEAIYNQNFDPRVSAKNGSIFGKGTYFARDASYSHIYSPANSEGDQFMFLAKVLVGRAALGNSSYTRPPSLNEDCASSLLYDSCVDKVKDPSIVIIFDNDQFYPYFIIRYQKIHSVIILS